MKRHLLWLFFVLVASGVGVAAYGPIMTVIREKPVEKTISFTLYKGSNYGSRIYRGSSAEISIIVEKVRNTNRTVVWDTTFDAQLLSKYPSLKKAMSQNITIPGVIESKEHLELNYVLTYNSNGSILKMQSGSCSFDHNDTVAITL